LLPSETDADTSRDFVVVHTQIEYSILPPAQVFEPPLTTCAVTQIAPVAGGLGERDGDGLGDDLEGDGDGDGDEPFFGVLFDGLGLAPFVGVDERLGFGLPDELGLAVGLGLRVGDGLVEELGLAVGLTLAAVVALTEGLESLNMLAWVADADPEPHVPPSGLACAANDGAKTGPAATKSPAPATTATRQARTALTGTRPSLALDPHWHSTLTGTRPSLALAPRPANRPSRTSLVDSVSVHSTVLATILPIRVKRFPFWCDGNPYQSMCWITQT
jgi:hypothetical protein